MDTMNLAKMVFAKRNLIRHRDLFFKKTKPSLSSKTKPSLHPLPRALGRRAHQTSCSHGRGEGR
jgi:hypothetical protein